MDFKDNGLKMSDMGTQKACGIVYLNVSKLNTEYKDL